MTNEKNKKTSSNVNMKSTIKHVGGYFTSSVKFLIIGGILSALSTISSLAAPTILAQITKELFDAIAAARAIDFSLIFQIIVILVILYIFNAVADYIGQRMVAESVQDASFHMRRTIQAKLERLPLQYFDKNPFGDVLSTITNDVDAISLTMQQTLTQMIRLAVQIVGVLVFMIVLSPMLTVAAVLTVPLSLFVSSLVIKKAQKYFIGTQEKLGKLNSYTEEMYSGFFVTKLYGKEADTIEKFKDVNGELAENFEKSTFYSSVMPALVRVVSNIGYAAVVSLSVIMVLGDPSSIWKIQPFLSYTRRFTMPFAQLSQVASSFQTASAASYRIENFLAEDELGNESDEKKLAEKISGDVLFKNVEFSYSDVPLIEELNAHIKPGQTVAIVGQTGAGKTTMINLLMRFYDIDSGDILIDGISIYDITREDLRSQMGMVLQDAWLFEGSIHDNIAYGKLGASREEVIGAAKIALIDHFIRTLPEGYDTIVEEDGGSLSHGQRQLITIARAVISDPSILILDEATSSVDTRTEALIQEAMKNVMRDRTSFIIAHRLSTIKNADIIFVMEQGRIVEQGSHDMLIEQNGKYAKLYNSQFADEVA